MSRKRHGYSCPDPRSLSHAEFNRGRAVVEPMHQRVAGIDVHRMKHVVTILIGQEDGAVSSQTREFGGFKRDMRALVAWLQTHHIQQVVMESTGIYWKSVFAHLEAAGIPALDRAGY